MNMHNIIAELPKLSQLHDAERRFTRLLKCR